MASSTLRSRYTKTLNKLKTEISAANSLYAAYIADPASNDPTVVTEKIPVIDQLINGNKDLIIGEIYDAPDNLTCKIESVKETRRFVDKMETILMQMENFGLDTEALPVRRIIERRFPGWLGSLIFNRQVTGLMYHRRIPSPQNVAHPAVHDRR